MQPPLLLRPMQQRLTRLVCIAGFVAIALVAGCTAKPVGTDNATASAVTPVPPPTKIVPTPTEVVPVVIEVATVAPEESTPAAEPTPFPEFDEMKYDEFARFWNGPFPDGWWLGLSADDVVALLGLPMNEEALDLDDGPYEFSLEYPNMSLSLLYGVHEVRVNGPQTCTASGVCVGDQVDDVVAAYGAGSWTSESRLVFNVEPIAGYCSVAFTFSEGDDQVNGEGRSITEMSSFCLPD